jgi:hypothetical protein
MKYLLGAGDTKEEGYIIVDSSSTCGADICADVTKFPWDWMEDEVDLIKSQNLLEHLSVDDRMNFFNEAWRKLKVGGVLSTHVPLLKLDEAHLMAAFTDISHKSYFTLQTFDYLDMDHQRGRIYGKDYGLKLWKKIRHEEWCDRFLICELQKV